MSSIASALYASGYQLPIVNGTASRHHGTMGGLFRSFAYCVAGTMGFVTPQALENRYSTSVAPVHYMVEGDGATTQDDVGLERTPAQDLARVREVLKPAVLELANLFGVSRQTVYDWQGGAQPAPKTAERLAKLASVADVFARASVAVEAKTLRRRIAGGGSLLDAVLSGGDAEQLARSLLPTLQREAAQRGRIDQQLAGRKRGEVNADDYGTPSVREDV